MCKVKLKIVLTEEADAFVDSLSEKAKRKVIYNLLRVEGGELDKELFKKLADTDIWEFRTLFNGVCYRLFAFWDTRRETLVIATHGIIKKTKRTPLKEIRKAEEVRRQYFENQNEL